MPTSDAPGESRSVRTDRTVRADRTPGSQRDHPPDIVASMQRSAEPPYRAVSSALRQRIQSGEWLPGEQLPTVRQIAAEYEVSVTTARRAITVLSDDGLVTVTPGWGIFRATT